MAADNLVVIALLLLIAAFKKLLATHCDVIFDCGVGERCILNNCTVPEKNGYCYNSLDCPSDQRCEWNECVDRTSIPIELKIVIIFFSTVFSLIILHLLCKVCWWRSSPPSNRENDQVPINIEPDDLPPTYNEAIASCQVPSYQSIQHGPPFQES